MAVWWRTALLVTLALALTGCRRATKDDTADDDATFAEDGTDTSAAESDAQLVTSSLVSSSSNGTVGLASADFVPGELAPSDIGDGARAIYFPRDCLTVVHDEPSHTVTYTFNRCLGPNGLHAVTGEVKARYASGPDSLHLELTATDLAINGASVDWAATADVRAGATEAERKMTWKAQIEGTSAGRRPFSRTSEHTVVWRLGEACFELSGISDGQIRGREIRTEIYDFKRCRRGCPEAGGKIAVTNVAKNRRIEILYDGTDRATFVGPGGKETSIALLCRP